MSGTGFRKASETRDLPETPSVTESPSEKRARWFKKATDARISLPSYNRPAGPPQPALTTTDATKIYDAAGIPESYNPYKSKVLEYMTEYSETIRPEQRVPVNELIEEAGSVCGRELQNNVTSIKPNFNEDQKFVALYGLAIALTNGYKQQYEAHFLVDPKTNEIIDLIHPHQQRQPKCDEFLKQKQLEKVKRQVNITGKEFDPYKGSQQGSRRRKTRKHSKKSKKTLRKRR